jgi:hypothetical protein
VTGAQQEIAFALEAGPRTARAITDELTMLREADIFSYDATHGRLRRMEDAELVRRLDRTTDGYLWELTHAGRRGL